MTWGSGTWGDGWGGDGSPATDVYGLTLDPADFLPGNYTVIVHAIDASDNANEAVGPPLRFTVPDLTPPQSFSFPQLPPSSDWEVFVRDADFQRVALIDSWAVLNFIERDRTIGAWNLESSEFSDEVIARLAQHGAGIVITRDGTVVFSGPVRHRQKGRAQDGTRTAVFSGTDDMIWLAARRVKPEPANPAPPYSTHAYDSQSGLASTVLRTYVDENLGPSATAGRLIPLVLDGDPAVGSTISYDARYEQLLALLVHLSNASTPILTFRLRQDDVDPTLRFSTGTINDQSAAICFAAELGNLTAYDFAEDAGDGNYVFGLGSGNGTSRVIVERAYGQSIIDWGRYELALDQRQTSTSSAIAAGDIAELNNHLDTRTLTLTTTPTRGMRWPTDYKVGDAVSVVIDDQRIVETVAEVRVDVDHDGETITPTVSNALAPNVPSLFRAVRALDERVTRTESQ